MKLASAIYPDCYPFQDMRLFDNYFRVIEPKELDKDCALVVWGGQDISPSLYNKPVSKRTDATEKLSSRDEIEWNLMKEALELGIPIIGICRGAQMLCALAGGYLAQDVTNHTRSHDVVTNTGERFKVSSLHHQMLYPFGVDHEMVAWTQEPLSEYYLDADSNINMPKESEFVYFPKERGIAIQWHPEFMPLDTPANDFVERKIREYCYAS